MSEKPFFFSNGGQRLFSVLHRPDHGHENCAWVFCHPFVEEKLWAHRVFVNMARELAEKSYPVLRFDYRGYGDSEGEFEDYTIDDQISDINRAIDVLRDEVPGVETIGLLGLRYGATLASMVAEKNEYISRLVLWDPVIDMDRYMQEALRANLTTQMVMHGKVITNRDELTRKIMNGESINIDGYDLTRRLFEPASKINLASGPKNFNSPCQIVQIGRASQPIKKDIESLADLYPDARVTKVVEEQFWKEIKNFVQRSGALSDSLFSWLEAC